MIMINSIFLTKFESFRKLDPVVLPENLIEREPEKSIGNMSYELSAIALVETSQTLPMKDPADHMSENEFFLGGIDEGVAGDEDFEGVKESGGDGGGEDCVDKHPYVRGPRIVPHHLKDLELDRSVENLAYEVDFG